MTVGEPETVVSASLQKIKSIKNPIRHFFHFFFIKSETSDSFVNHFDGHFAYLKTLNFYFKAVGDEVKLQDLIPPGFVIYSCPHKGHPAGGIAVLYCDTLHNCVSISSKEHSAESFESCETQVN